MRRLLIIGLDGATFDVILPWVEQGKLPNIAKLLARGTHGELKSTIPSMTFPSWTSFMTGKNPGKHGIFDFTEREPGGYGIRFVNATYMKSRTIWQLLGDMGKRVAAISVPVTYPPEKVNGIMISGFDAPGMSRGKADARSMYPPELHQELVDKVGGYAITANAVALAGAPDKALRAIQATIDQKAKCAKYLYQKEPWDLFMIVLGETDSIAHHFWKYHDSRCPLGGPGPSAALRDAIFSIYERADAFIGDMVKNAWEGTTVMLVSDHGTGGCSDDAVYLNLWLEQEGFLRYRADADSALRSRTSRLTMACVDRAKKIGVKVVPPAIKAWLLRRRPGLVNRMESYLRFNTIDWEQTVAFADENPYYPEIWLNVRGREPQGQVSQGAEYEKVRDQIIERLHGWLDPQNGQRVVREAFRREALYTGPYVDKAPDILVEWNLKDGYTYVPRLSKAGSGALPLRKLRGAERASTKSGSHREFGIFALAGEGVREGTVVKGAEIIDVAPTILYLLGAPVPEDVDGKVLEGAIADDFLQAHPVSRVQGGEAAPERAEETYSGEEAEIIEERLRGLGYIE